MRLLVPIIVLSFFTTISLSQAAMLKKDFEGGKYTFEWEVVGQDMNVKLTAKTTGWVAVGFNATSMMKDANIIIGYVKDGTAVIEDHFGKSAVKHAKDKSQNITNAQGKEAAGVTELSFTIPLNSSDKEDSAINPEASTKVIMAFGDKDDLKAKHSFVQTAEINLKTGK